MTLVVTNNNVSREFTSKSDLPIASLLAKSFHSAVTEFFLPLILLLATKICDTLIFVYRYNIQSWCKNLSR